MNHKYLYLFGGVIVTFMVMQIIFNITEEGKKEEKNTNKMSSPKKQTNKVDDKSTTSYIFKQESQRFTAYERPTTYTTNFTSTLQQTVQSVRKSPRIPLIFHQIFINKQNLLPSSYGICLYSLLRNHRFRDGRQKRNASIHGGEFDYYFWNDQSITEYKNDHLSANSSESDRYLQKTFQHLKFARETIEVTDMVRLN